MILLAVFLFGISRSTAAGESQPSANPQPIPSAQDGSEHSNAELTRRVQVIANEPDAILRYQETEDLVANLPEGQFPRVLDIILLPGASDNDGLMGLAAKTLRRWVELSPEAAVAWVRRVPDHTVFGREAYGIVGEAKARADSAQALRWLTGLPNGENRYAAQAAIASVIARTDAVAALHLAEELPRSQDRDGLVSFCVLNWCNRDFDAAAAWVRRLPDATERGSIGARLAMQEGVQRPDLAAKFAVDALPSGPEKTRAVAQIVRFWSAATPQPAADWVLRFPKGELQDAALEALVETWARKDGPQAATWLHSLPPDRFRDLAIRAFVNAAPPSERGLAPGTSAPGAP